MLIHRGQAVATLVSHDVAHRRVAAKAGKEALHPSLKGAERRILLIDDSFLILKVMTTTLNRLGFTAVTAEDGQSGLLKAKERMFAAIMCDINLPVLDGFGFVQALREWEREQGPQFR